MSLRHPVNILARWICKSAQCLQISWIAVSDGLFLHKNCISVQLVWKRHPRHSRVAVCCSVLQCVAVCCRVLEIILDLPFGFPINNIISLCRVLQFWGYDVTQAIAPALQHTATHCNTLQHTATHCNTLQHTATHYNTLQHAATRLQATHATAQTFWLAEAVLLCIALCRLRYDSDMNHLFMRSTWFITSYVRHDPYIHAFDMIMVLNLLMCAVSLTAWIRSQMWQDSLTQEYNICAIAWGGHAQWDFFNHECNMTHSRSDSSLTHTRLRTTKYDWIRHACMMTYPHKKALSAHFSAQVRPMCGKISENLPSSTNHFGPSTPLALHQDTLRTFFGTHLPSRKGRLNYFY